MHNMPISKFPYTEDQQKPKYLNLFIIITHVYGVYDQPVICRDRKKVAPDD